MTKKELAEFERLKTALALRFTDAPEGRDVPKPECGSGATSGWLGNPHSRTVGPHWSEYGSHGTGPVRDSRYCGSQNGIALHSTKLRALKAMRREVERACAKELRAIDIQIEEEEAKA